MNGTGMSYMRRREIKAGLLFISPLMIGLLIFYFYAFVQNVYISFTQMGSFGPPVFSGLENYRRLFDNPKFYGSLGNTVKYVLWCVPSIVVISTMIAYFLSRIKAGSSFFRTTMFIPAVTMPAAIGILWRWLYNYKFGIINAVLNQLGFEGIAWLSEGSVVVFSISVVLVWTMVSTQMIILLAGLQSIPIVYYEAARIDGATGIQSFFKVTLPLLSPSLFFVITITTINVFQIFDFIFLMIRPTTLAMQYSMSLVYYFYDRGFIAFEKGYAATISMVLFAIILLITAVQFKLQKKWVHYS